MPELPEVETIVRELNRALPGRAVATVRVFRRDALGRTSPAAFGRSLEGRRFGAVSRRGKFLLFALEPSGHLVAHLRMTGKFILSAPLPAPLPHHRVWFHLRDGGLLIFQDLRCFGTLAVVDRPEDVPGLTRLGPDPLAPEFTRGWLAGALKESRAPLKHWLMDQTRLAGLGNIYACEALHAAGLGPRRKARAVTAPQAARLHVAIRSILNRAIEKNGTTISDFRRVDDQTGEFQRFLKVYGREGEPCPGCGAAIRRIRQQQRSTFYCARCQP
jgi:formamidopyrimidine-DNA glycosylase